MRGREIKVERERNVTGELEASPQMHRSWSRKWPPPVREQDDHGVGRSNTRALHNSSPSLPPTLEPLSASTMPFERSPIPTPAGDSTLGRGISGSASEFPPGNLKLPLPPRRSDWLLRRRTSLETLRRSRASTAVRPLSSRLF